VIKRFLPSQSITSLQFFSRLTWLDGRNLLETIEPYRREIFTRALDSFGTDGRPIYNIVLAGRGKKNNKSLDAVLASMFCVLMRRSVQGNKALILANDEGQAGDDLDLAKKLVERNPELRNEFDVLAKELRLKDGSGGIRILPAGDSAGLHGKTYCNVTFDEIHEYRDWSILEALQPDPTRPDSLMWITSYDSIFDEPGTPLHDLGAIGFAGSDPRMLFSWYSADRCTDPVFAELDGEARANPSMDSWPEGRDYIEQQRRRLPANIFKRLHLNLPGSASPFINLEDWDFDVDPQLRPLLEDRALPVWIGVDAGYKHDYSAIVVVSYAEHRVRLVYHRIFKPTPHSQLDFEQTIEQTLLDLRRRFAVCKILYDPYQMVALAQRLQKSGLPMEEFRQSPPNLTLASQNLFELLTGHNIALYPDAEMRQAAAHAIAIETTGGWRIAKERTSHRIDVIVALAQAAYAAVKMRPLEAPPIVAAVIMGRGGQDISAVPPSTGSGINGPNFSMRDNWSPRW
jgi:phage terminase large subunit-like protein